MLVRMLTCIILGAVQAKAVRRPCKAGNWLVYFLRLSHHGIVPTSVVATLAFNQLVCSIQLFYTAIGLHALAVHQGIMTSSKP